MCQRLIEQFYHSSVHRWNIGKVVALVPVTVPSLLMIVLSMQQCFLWIAPQGHQLRTEFTVCLLQISCRPLGELWPGQDHFLALRLQIFFGHQQNAHSILWKSGHGRRASVFVLDFIVDFTDLMMTSCLLPPTQRHTHRTFAGVYFIISWRYSTAPDWLSSGK